MNLRAQVLSAVRWYASLRLLAQAVTWAVSLIVVRLLTPADYGLAALAVLPIGLITLINELGLGAAVIQREQIDRQLIRQAFTVVLLVNTLLLLLTLAAAPLVGSFFSQPALAPIVAVLSLQFLIASIGVIPEALLIRAMNFRVKSFAELLAGTGGALLTLTLALMGKGVWALVWGSVASAAIKTLALSLMSGVFVIPTTRLSGARRLMTFGGLITLDRILWYGYSRADILIAGKLLGTVPVGTYSVAMDVASLPMQKVNGILNEVAFPAFARIQQEPVLVGQYLFKAVRLVAFVACPVFVGIASVAHVFVPLVLGERWSTTAPMIAVLALVMPLRMVSNLITSTLQGVGRADVTVGNLIIACVLMPTAFYLGARSGAQGIAWAWLLSYPVYFAIELQRSRRVLGVRARDVLMCLYPGAISAVTMAAVVLGVDLVIAGALANWLRLLVLIVTGVVAFAALAWGLSRSTMREVMALARP